MIPFLKMNGLGNDFLVVDARKEPVRPRPEIIRKLADRASGVGFDQFITIERTNTGADAFMRIDNADGGEVEACGNATRCVGWLLMQEGGRETASVLTVAGLLNARLEGARAPFSQREKAPAKRADEGLRSAELSSASNPSPVVSRSETTPSPSGRGNPLISVDMGVA
jgi:diaminopimelate epimerase